jgi:hypothetical protein
LRALLSALEAALQRYARWRTGVHHVSTREHGLGDLDGIQHHHHDALSEPDLGRPKKVAHTTRWVGGVHKCSLNFCSTPTAWEHSPKQNWCVWLGGQDPGFSVCFFLTVSGVYGGCLGGQGVDRRVLGVSWLGKGVSGMVLPVRQVRGDARGLLNRLSKMASPKAV